jgi:hypothetical protein
MRALLASYNAAPHNRYQPHPAEPEQHTKYSNRAFVLLKMGIMMPETHPAEPEQHTKYSNRAFVLLTMGIMMPETC